MENANSGEYNELIGEWATRPKTERIGQLIDETVTLIARYSDEIKRYEAMAGGDPRFLELRLIRAVSHLAHIAHVAKPAAELLAVEAVQNSTLSRKQAADYVGVHQVTVARWVREMEETGEVHALMEQLHNWLWVPAEKLDALRKDEDHS